MKRDSKITVESEILRFWAVSAQTAANEIRLKDLPELSAIAASLDALAEQVSATGGFIIPTVAPTAAPKQYLGMKLQLLQRKASAALDGQAGNP